MAWLGWWLKAKFPHANFAITNFILNIEDLSLLTLPKRSVKLVLWMPPPSDTWKINVDGSSLGKPGPAGIGGAVRNSTGEE
ncbi:hypothetical protein COLO4_36265 [Corchorus olitorius]|uniref:RNase H type-1 domain-containing protein n=1 Tax=Corchorus olitorius TaxID=93759 RepID=A0A1R3GA68_9ROSI|nr:hypothetical protein COLO4_36265 [Corchorus olitorius]